MYETGNVPATAGTTDQPDAAPLPAAGRKPRMARAPLYPLRFEPIFTTNLWGGRRLPGFLNRTVTHADPIGEAWVLSDVDGSLSRVADGPLAGASLRELLALDPARIVGAATTPQGRFPLLLKFLDARQELSVQVHRTTPRPRGSGRGSSARRKRGWCSTATPPPAASTPGSPRV